MDLKFGRMMMMMINNENRKIWARNQARAQPTSIHLTSCVLLETINFMKLTLNSYVVRVRLIRIERTMAYVRPYIVHQLGYSFFRSMLHGILPTVWTSKGKTVANVPTESAFRKNTRKQGTDTEIMNMHLNGTLLLLWFSLS